MGHEHPAGERRDHPRLHVIPVEQPACPDADLPVLGDRLRDAVDPEQRGQHRVLPRHLQALGDPPRPGPERRERTRLRRRLGELHGAAPHGHQRPGDRRADRCRVGVRVQVHADQVAVQIERADPREHQQQVERCARSAGRTRHDRALRELEHRVQPEHGRVRGALERPHDLRRVVSAHRAMLAVVGQVLGL